MNIENLKDLPIAVKESDLEAISHVKKRNVPVIDERAIIEDLKIKLFYDIKNNSIIKFAEHLKEAERKRVKKKILLSSFTANDTLLHFAAFYGRYAIVELLLKDGAEIDDLNKHEWTPLITASIKDNIEIVNLLICNGADTSIGLIDIDITRKIFPGISVTSKEILTLSSYTNLLIKSECFKGQRRIYNARCVAMEKKFLIFTEGINSEYCKAYKIDSSIVNVKHVKDLTPAALLRSKNSYESNYPTVTSSATKASFFINNLVNWIVHSSANAIVSVFHSITDSLSTHQHSVGYSNKSFSQDNVNGLMLLADVYARRSTGVKYSGLSNELTLTKEQILESKINSVKRSLELGVSIFEKMNQCPQSSLNDTQISKVKTCEKSL